jgi:hypothetical protein
MAQTLRKMDDDDTLTLDPEGRNRIDQVRLRQLSFRIKQLYPKLPDADVEALAVAVLETTDEVKNPTGSDLRDRLVRHGHADEYARKLVSSIGFEV